MRMTKLLTSLSIVPTAVLGLVGKLPCGKAIDVQLSQRAAFILITNCVCANRSISEMLFQVLICKPTNASVTEVSAIRRNRIDLFISRTWPVAVFYS